MKKSPANLHNHENSLNHSFDHYKSNSTTFESMAKNKNVLASIESISKDINTGRYSQASKKIRKLEKKHQPDDRLHMMQAIIADAKGDFDTALDHCQRAMALAPTKEVYCLTKVELLIKQDNITAARELLIHFLDQHPENIKALTIMSDIFFRQNEKHLLFMTLLRLAGTTKLNNIQLANIFSLSSEVVLISFSQSMIRGLINILDYKMFSTIGLSQNIGSYVTHKYDMQNPSPKLALEDIYSDTLLIKALPLIRINRPEVERFLTTIREALLITTLSNQTINPQGLNLIRAIALQNHLNEFVSYINDREIKLLGDIKKLIKVQTSQSEWTPYASEALLLLISMYQSLYTLENVDLLLSFPIQEWPQSLADIANDSLFSLQNEFNTINTIESLTSIENSVSLNVQKQYEQNPYPRWNMLYAQNFRSIGHILSQLYPDYSQNIPADLFKENTNILIAGGGTGHQPICCAKNFPKSNIVSIDISKRSLAYAKIKAKQYDVKNIKFFHADILKLPKRIGVFSYIECCGVLHHMESPIHGWKKLLSLLAPGGFMKIALYSTLARTEITAERDKIRQLDMEPTTQNIRLYRQALLTKDNSIIPRMFLDFYILSECRDLLFHQHEQCFSWPKIQRYCQELNIKFVGLAGSNQVNEDYLKANPEQSNTQSLETLASYEENNQHAFRAMYQFIIQKPIKSKKPI